MKEQTPSKVTDVNDREILVGSRVRLRSLIGDNTSRVCAEGSVYSLAGMHGNPNESMVWIKGQPAHHPKATEVI